MQSEALLNESRKPVSLLYTCILVDCHTILTFSIYDVNRVHPQSVGYNSKRLFAEAFGVKSAARRIWMRESMVTMQAR